MELFTKKAETLNDRIKNLRKEKGWTQLKLAEQLNITDKAVSKWESGEGNPDITLLPKLAELFGVTIDYLLTGVKPEEKVNLDDMDNAKRAIYLIGNDDLQNFIKYNYFSSDYLLNPSYIEKQCRENVTLMYAIRTEILKIKPKKILNALLDEFVSTNKYKNQLAGKISPATLVYDYLDEFVKICATLNRVDVLEYIKFHWFAIGDKNSQRGNYQPYQAKHTYLISSEVFTFIMEDPSVNEETKKYVLKINLFDYNQKTGERKYYFLNDEIIYCMYNNKLHDLLENTMLLLHKNNENLLTKFIHCYDYPKKYISDNVCWMGVHSTPSYPFSVGVIVPIIKAFKKAKENLDIKWIEIFNEYNLFIEKHFSNYMEMEDVSKLYEVVLNVKELNILKMEADPNVSNDEILIYSYTKNGLLDTNGLLGSLMESANSVNELKKVIEIVKRIYKNYIKASYVHPIELIKDSLSKKDYKKIFEFAVDNDIKELIEPILTQKYSEILDVVKKLSFNPSSKLMRICQNAYMSNSGLFECIRIQKGTTNNFVSICEQYKEGLLNDFIKNVLDEIDNLTGEREIKENYDCVCNEITKDYLLDLFNKNRDETLIIKLCVKLEAKFKYIYKLSGEFKVMLDEYISKHMKLYNCYDDYDNNYSFCQSQDAYNIMMKKLLNKLRIIRNGIVHSSSSSESLSDEELLQIIEFVEKL